MLVTVHAAQCLLESHEFEAAANAAVAAVKEPVMDFSLLLHQMQILAQLGNHWAAACAGRHVRLDTSLQNGHPREVGLLLQILLLRAQCLVAAASEVRDFQGADVSSHQKAGESDREGMAVSLTRKQSRAALLE